MITGSSFGVICTSPRYFAAGQLAIALNARLYAVSNGDLDFTLGKRAIAYHGQQVDCDHLLVVGVTALKKSAKVIRSGKYKSVAVVFSDTRCCTDYLWWNRFVKDHGIPVYAMPDLAQYCIVPYTPCYQTMTLPDVPIVKNQRLTIAHSPNAKGIYKGTPAIRRVLKKLRRSYDFDYVEIIGKTWQESVRIKAGAHIFIDQLTYGNPEIPQKRFGGRIPYHGALGKSGLEGMLLGCCTITGAREVKTEPWFPTPPALWTSKKYFENTLELVITGEVFRNGYITQQREWAQKYTSPEFVTANLTRHIRDERIVRSDVP